eukprot:TRINITY_DN14530_c1_g3_i1.p1 TRINITY_DN14530_c1_g3~~TRINITY_DN14530_c1_g3_i1.p1  ORF type:complete len:451 (+),score=23.69 TRINITY_DN14530_c1_g3_i1:26-1354(+)
MTHPVQKSPHRKRSTRSRTSVLSQATAITALSTGLICFKDGARCISTDAFLPAPGSITLLSERSRPSRSESNVIRRHLRDGKSSFATVAAESEDPWYVKPAVGSAAAIVLSEVGSAPFRPSAVFGNFFEHYGSMNEDLFLIFVLGVTVYCLGEMSAMTMMCPHREAKIHTTANALAALFSVYGIVSERIFRESPGLWWGILTPLLYLVSNFTMTRLMKMYKGPMAYKRLFDLGQSFTLSFQGIHCLAWSSVYPQLYWLALPFWYWSLKKLVEPVTYLFGVIAGENASAVEEHKARSSSWGAFGLEFDAVTICFTLVNFAAALADNAYMGAYTLRGPDGFFEVSRSLADDALAGGWGSDHLRMALVKPAVGSLVVSMAVFLGTLVSRKRLPLAVGVPISVLLSSIGPWFVFFWHRLVDPDEPWLPEFLGDFWGPGPLAQFLGF